MSPLGKSCLSFFWQSSTRRRGHQLVAGMLAGRRHALSNMFKALCLFTVTDISGVPLWAPLCAMHPSNWVMRLPEAVMVTSCQTHACQATLLPLFTLEAGFCCSEVVEVGSGVDHMREGTRVALEPQIPCWGNKMARSVSFARVAYSWDACKYASPSS